MANDLKLTTLLSSQPHYLNLSPSQLVEEAILRKEALLTAGGALRVTTGRFTGRSPKDKYVVQDKEALTLVNWGDVNQPMSTEAFEGLYARLQEYLTGRELFVFDGFAGAASEHRLAVRVVNEYAWQNLFIHQLLIRPEASEAADFSPDFTVICAPGFRAIPAVDGTRSETFVAISFARRLVLIGGTEYAGEMKKAVFTVMNYLLPQKGILSMHCSANVDDSGQVALFFGLSGTGKTTLSADPERHLIGDDEHGWSDQGVFNIEGGCYAKCIHLQQESEPQIWSAIRFGTVLENVMIDEKTREIDFDDASLTENTRAAYPLDHIPGARIPSVAGHPSAVIFLTADAFGVLPPIARLSREQAMYHFLSGYTSKLAGTERGITQPEATFSTCFGEPFLPLRPARYAQLLGERLERHGSSVYLVNTGWTGGPYGVGKRMPIRHTRSMVRAAVNGALDKVEYRVDPAFGLEVPVWCPGVPDCVLDPAETWTDKNAYYRSATDLARRFRENFERFDFVPDAIRRAGPKG